MYIIYVAGRLSLYKNYNMKLIYIKSTMEPKNYSTIRSILKKNKEKKLLMFLKSMILKHKCSRKHMKFIKKIITNKQTLTQFMMNQKT